MPTVILVLLAIAVAVLAVSALALIRWREQQRLARAREAVHQADQITALGSTGQCLQPWLSADLLRVLANAVQFHADAFQQCGMTPNNAIIRACEQARGWQASQNSDRPPLPCAPREAQQLQQGIRFLLNYLRQSYKAGRLQARETRSYLYEARLLNLKITLAVYLAKAATAAKLNNHHQAIFYLRKAVTLLTGQDELPEELAPALEDIRSRLQHHEEEHQRNNQGTRLEAEAAALSAEDDSWKKKKFD